MCKRLFKALKIKMDNYHLRYELAGTDEEIGRLREENEKLKKQIRKEVVQEIYWELSRIEDTLINLGNGKEDALQYFIKILDRIKGEDNEKINSK